MLLEELAAIHVANPAPMIVRGDETLRFSDISTASGIGLGSVRQGDVVALVGDFTPDCINALLRLVELKAIIVPLSPETSASFPYYFEQAGVDVVIEDGVARRIRNEPLAHPLLKGLRDARHAGLILFSSGTTGQPKAILHDFDKFLVRFRTRRPALVTLNFLLFDHIGGINTLLHTIFNRGMVVVPSGRTPEAVAGDIERHGVELLPATPTFLRMLLLSGAVDVRPEAFRTLKVVTYGTEPMDENTLRRLCALLPQVDFRQTYGMSELGILRIKSKARDSLWMSVGGEGIETRTTEANVLQIRAGFRMLGYLNAPAPFVDGWYDTGDVVEREAPWLKIVGRAKQIINVGGIKVLPTEVERVGLLHPEVVRCRVVGASNPISGQHIEVTCELQPGATADRAALKAHFAAHMAEAIRPHRIRIGDIGFNHRFKKE
jgi:long-chain acyl-CoA synthetase